MNRPERIVEAQAGGRASRGPSERRILEGALRAVARLGARRLSMSDVCHEAGVSRATVYRHFSTMDDLLGQLAEFVMISSEEGLAAATAAQSDPVEKFRAALAFTAAFNAEHPTTGMLVIDPVFAVEFLNRHFDRHVAAMRRAVAPLCEMLERDGGPSPDPAMLAELIVRSHLSLILVPGREAWSRFADQATELIRACTPDGPSHVGRG